MTKLKNMITVMGGDTIKAARRPHWWKNESPLVIPGQDRANSPDMLKLPLDTFPLIEDFAIRLETFGGKSSFGYHLHFFSPSRGYVASFPWWDHVEKALIQPEFKPPLASLDQPYSDLDQGWMIVIAADKQYVYVLQSKFDQGVGFDQWFRVERARYVEAWQAAIDLCRRVD